MDVSIPRLRYRTCFIEKHAQKFNTIVGFNLVHIFKSSNIVKINVFF